MKKHLKGIALHTAGLFGVKANTRVRRKQPGQIPGTAIHTGEKRMDEVRITLHDFDEEHYHTSTLKGIEKSAKYLKSESRTWIQVEGLHDIDRLRTIWEYFGLHPLIQEDIVSISQRPKVEVYDDLIYIVLRSITLDESTQKLQSEQVSIVLGKNYVLSFQESDTPIFEPIFRRLQTTTTRLRRLGPDYLMYALIDTIVDHYFVALDLLGELIEKAEESVVGQPDSKELPRIHALRRDLIIMRKSVWSLRDGINSLIRDDIPLISQDIKIYLRDVYDHVVQIIDSIETSREMVFSLFDIYMSGMSNRMNEVMKVLTIIATIFIPLTFIAGIYGMNFDPEASPWNMPELNMYYGYPVAMAGMLILSLGMLYYFRRRGWL
ncbi:MAG: magnesium/cobalt transporter CorA [Bacteroidetes bacterium]|nr:magnesium/cobalt transporter CorA [Bacteroidota bacterium]MCH8523332.1 magnesium/cobalt transporter CorA [Balneolales bacterium]